MEACLSSEIERRVWKRGQKILCCLHCNRTQKSSQQSSSKEKSSLQSVGGQENSIVAQKYTCENYSERIHLRGGERQPVESKAVSSKREEWD